METPKTFTQRLETYRRFRMKNDFVKLAKLGYYQTGDGIIVCSSCGVRFINWNGDDEFYEKHHETDCEFIDYAYIYDGSNKHEQKIEDWIERIKERIPEKVEDLDDEYLYFLVFRYLLIKGNHASLDYFEDYLDYSLDE